MRSLEGKKIFVLYPDSFLREDVFYGSLRNQFQIYFIYDYEKVRAISERFPGCIICINLINNDLRWMLDELRSDLSGFCDEEHPRIVLMSDSPLDIKSRCCNIIDCKQPADLIRRDLLRLFNDIGGKGRRNFVRYGSYSDNVARIAVDVDGIKISGVVHDISVSGLSCSFPDVSGCYLMPDTTMDISLNLSGRKLLLRADKVLERDFDGRNIHILQFKRGMSDEKLDELYSFIHQSLDARMEEKISKFSINTESD